MNKNIRTTQKKPLNLSGLLVKLVLLWLILAFIIFPNLNLLVNIFSRDGSFSTSVFTKVLSSTRAKQSMINSFILAFSLVITVNIVGTLVVLFTEYWDIKGAKLLKMGYMTSLVYGGIVLVTGYKFIYGSKGIVTNLLLQSMPEMNKNWFVGYGAVLFIMTFACTSNHIIFLTNAIRGMDYHMVEAARNMSASNSRIFFRVVLPTLKPTMFALTILTFLTGLSALSAPMLVGGPSFQTINPMIITFANSPSSRDIAALLAVVLGIATIILIVILTKVEKGGNYISVAKTKARLQKQKITNPIANVFAHIVAYIMFLIYMAPICLVVLFSFSDSLAIKTGKLSLGALTLENYKHLFTARAAFRPYLISIVYSLLAAVIVTIIAVAVSKIVHKSKSRLNLLYEYSVLIPWLLPGTLIALGLMMTYDVPRLILGNQVLIGTLVLLLIGYVVVKLPFSYRMIKAAFFSVEDSLEEAAKSMGASAFYTLCRVTVPVIFPAILSVIVLNFNSLLADFDVTVFLYHPFYQPLGMVIKAASDEAATSNAQAMTFVYTVVLILISSVVLYFTQGNGMERIKQSTAKRNQKKISRLG